MLRLQGMRSLVVYLNVNDRHLHLVGCKLNKRLGKYAINSIKTVSYNAVNSIKNDYCGCRSLISCLENHCRLRSKMILLS